MIWGAYDQFLLLSGNSFLIKFDSHNITAKWVVIKGEALLTVGYTIFGNKSYSYKMYS